MNALGGVVERDSQYVGRARSADPLLGSLASIGRKGLQDSDLFLRRSGRNSRGIGHRPLFDAGKVGKALRSRERSLIGRHANVTEGSSPPSLDESLNRASADAVRGIIACAAQSR